MARFVGTTFIALFAVLSIYIVMVSARLPCWRCQSYQCCITSRMGSQYCKRLSNEGQSCNPKVEFGGLQTYLYGCPCQAGLECKPQDIMDVDGISVKSVGRCVNTTSEEQETEAAVKE